MTVAAGRFSALGALPPNSSVSVYVTGTKTLATLYADKISGTTVPNPVPVDEFGNLAFFVVPGDVDLAVPHGSATETITVTVPADPTEAWPG